MLYLIDRNTKEKIAMGTDMRKVQMLMDVLKDRRPCFIIAVIVGGKSAQVA